MKVFLWVVTVLGSVVLGCGDNSKQCGPGTIENNGVCEPDGTQPPACTDGTILDVNSNSCVIDPNACQDGTVLIGSECKDPYLLADTTTAFADVCAVGTVIALANDNDAMSATITGPASFLVFGVAASNFRVSSNGFLTFNTALAASSPDNVDMPTTGQPNAVIAPYWDDLAQVEACTGVVGGKTVIQWTGVVFATGDPVELQAILDPADDTIEFVWGPNHDAFGGSATIGVENQAGDKSKVVGFNQGNTALPATSKKLTPQ